MTVKNTLICLLLFMSYSLRSQTVYVNNFNYIYHTKDCKKVKSSYYGVDLKDAINNNYKECKECKPLRYLKQENDDKPIKFTKVIYTDSVGRNKLFVFIKEWFATNFKSANDVIQMEDKESGVIIGNGKFAYSNGNKIVYTCYSGYINFTIKVYVKDNRYKVEIINFNHESSGNQYSSSLCSLGVLTNSDIANPKGVTQSVYNSVWADAKQKMKLQSEQIFMSLEMFTNKLSFSKEVDGW